jgi:hypothetical protein
MGEAKLRQEAQARGIPTVPRRKIFTNFEKTFARLCKVKNISVTI